MAACLRCVLHCLLLRPLLCVLHCLLYNCLHCPALLLPCLPLCLLPFPLRLPPHGLLLVALMPLLQKLCDALLCCLEPCCC